MKPGRVPYDWSRIETWQAFEKLVAALLRYNANLGPADVMSCDPRAGADDGWDAATASLDWVREHPLVQREPDDRWVMVQAKHTSKDFERATGALSTALRGTTRRKGEIQKALDADAKALALFTSAQLRVDQQKQLRALALERGVPLLLVERERLNMMLDQAPWVAHQFLGAPLRPALVPDLPPRAWGGLIDTGFRYRENEIDELSDLVNAMAVSPARAGRVDGHQVILLHAPGGHGKSTFVREWAKRHAESGFTPVLFFHDVRSALDTVQDELMPRPIAPLVVIDDAHRLGPTEIRPFVHILRSEQPHTRGLVLVSRTAEAGSLRNLLGDERIRYEELRLRSLTPPEIADLIRQRTDRVDADRLAERLGSNLFLAQFALSRLTDDRAPLDITGQEAIVAALAREVVSDIQTALGLDKRSRAVEIAVTLATLAPFHVDDDMEPVLAGLGCDKHELQGWLSALEHAGIGTRSWSGWSFTSEVVAELTLLGTLRAAASARDELVRRLVAPAARTDPQRIARLAVLAREPGMESAKRLVTAWFDEQIPQLDQQPRYALRGIFEAAAQLAAVAPARVRRLIGTALTNDVATDEVEHAIVALARVQGQMPAALRLLARPVLWAPEGYYRRARPERVVRGLLDPYRERLGVIRELLSTLHEWLSEDAWSPQRTAIVGEAIGAVLATAVERTRLRGDSLHLDHVPLPDDSRWLELRGRAVALLEEMTRRPQPEVRRAAVLALTGSVVDSYLLTDDQRPLAGQAANDRVTLLAQWTAWAPRETDPGVLAALWTGLLRWWLKGWPQHELAREVLRQLPESVEATARAAVAHEPFALRFDELEALLAGVEASRRWNLWVFELLEPWWQAQSERIAQLLAERLEQTRNLGQVLAGLGEVTPGECTRGCPRWLARLAHLRFSDLDRTYRDAPLWDEVPDWARSWLRDLWLWSADDALSYTRRELPENLHEANLEQCLSLFTALRAEAGTGSEHDRRTLLLTLAAHPDEEVRRTALDEAMMDPRFGFIEGTTGRRLRPKQFVELLGTLVHHGPEDVSTGRGLHYLQDHVDDLTPRVRRELVRALEAALRRHGWSLGSDFYALLDIALDDGVEPRVRLVEQLAAQVPVRFPDLARVAEWLVATAGSVADVELATTVLRSARPADGHDLWERQAWYHLNRAQPALTRAWAETAIHEDREDVSDIAAWLLLGHDLKQTCKSWLRLFALVAGTQREATADRAFSYLGPGGVPDSGGYRRAMQTFQEELELLADDVEHGHPIAATAIRRRVAAIDHELAPPPE